MRRSHLLLLLALNCGWAAVPTLATRLEGRLGALEFIFLRYAFALAAIVAVWPWLPGALPRGRDFLRTALMGVTVFTVGHWFQIGGIQLSQASDASILLALDPLVSSLGAALFLHEGIPLRRWAGFALAMGGVAWMSWWRREAPLPGLLANLLILLSYVSESVWSVMGKPLVSRWGIPKVTGLALAAGTLANAVLLAIDPSPSLQHFTTLPAGDWAMLAILGIVLTAFGYSAWYLVIREVPVSTAAMTIYLQPIIGTVLAVTWAGEALHAGHIGGCLAIIAGLVVGIRMAGTPAQKAASTPPAPEK